MWTYTYGLTSMIATTPKSTLTIDDYYHKLEQAGNKMIIYHLFSSGKIENCFGVMAQKIHQKKYLVSLS